MKFLPSKKTFRAFSKYFLFGSAVFAVGLVWNFPLEKISQTFTQRLAKQTGYEFTMDTLDPALPIGFKATDFQVEGLQKDPLVFSNMRLTVSPLSLLTYPFKKSLNVSYVAEKNKTEWTGSIAMGPELLAGDISTEDWRLNEEFPLDKANPMLAGMFLKAKAQIAANSALEGETKAIQKGDLSKANGDFHVIATKTILDVPMLKKDFRMTTKQIRFDKVEAKGTLKEGKLTIESISLMGPDITGTANGKITLSPYFPRSRLELEAKLKLSEKAADIRSLIDSFGSALNLRVSDDGTMAFKVTGPVTPVDRWRVRGY